MRKEHFCFWFRFLHLRSKFRFGLEYYDEKYSSFLQLHYFNLAMSLADFQYFFEVNREITRDIKGIFLSLKPPNQMGVVYLI